MNWTGQWSVNDRFVMVVLNIALMSLLLCLTTDKQIVFYTDNRYLDIFSNKIFYVTIFDTVLVSDITCSKSKNFGKKKYSDNNHFASHFKLK